MLAAREPGTTMLGALDHQSSAVDPRVEEPVGRRNPKPESAAIFRFISVAEWRSNQGPSDCGVNWRYDPGELKPEILKHGAARVQRMCSCGWMQQGRRVNSKSGSSSTLRYDLDVMVVDQAGDLVGSARVSDQPVAGRRFVSALRPCVVGACRRPADSSGFRSAPCLMLQPAGIPASFAAEHQQREEEAMKLDVNALRYLSKDDFRVLTAVEMGMRNHEIVPSELIDRIAGLKHGGTYKVLRNLLKNKLVHHEATKYIFEVATEDGTVLAMKLHRLGRTSFRAALGEHGFPVPTAVDCNRHCVIMSLVQGYPLVQVKELQNPDDVFDTILGLVIRLAEHGLIHCDFNEFNIMIGDDEEVTMIDFPQMVSVSHRNAQMFFDRDIECIYKFFKKRFHLSSEKCEEQDGLKSMMMRMEDHLFLSVQKSDGSLDKELAASGFTRKEQVEMDKYIHENAEEESSDDDDSTSEQDSEDGDEATVKISSLKIADQDSAGAPDHTLRGRDSNQPETSSEENETSPGLNGENKLANQSSSSKGDTTEAPESGGNADNDDDSSEDPDGEDDDSLAKQLNKHRKRAIAAAHGRRRPLSSRNTLKDKGKGTMNSKSRSRHANGDCCSGSFLAGKLKIGRACFGRG
ncbi:hypothetical protein GUJ93_ZPchr0001g32077 [Zizania palustris]|uniref:non-specific serine/threonine protein kinase n=1 Tax=Zizania palustris TaxID=103762 RepID=A0A8J5V8L0_ZIZPA|nr:hypothetical protein GUJ93_ZPchr0001g32077 [Zizania palustris]